MMQDAMLPFEVFIVRPANWQAPPDYLAPPDMLVFVDAEPEGLDVRVGDVFAVSESGEWRGGVLWQRQRVLRALQWVVFRSGELWVGGWLEEHEEAIDRESDESEEAS
jgi:hypothetical protein